MSESEKDFIKRLFKEGTIRLLVVIYTMCWNIDDLESHIVVILDAERFDGHEHRAVEYPIPDVL
jgi:pre-mRNA-splicing helicase BRR2